MKNVCFAIFFVALFLQNSCFIEEELTGNYISETIESPTTFKSGETYIIDGYIDVISDLVIEAGAVVKFEEDAGLNIGTSGNYGSLKATGTADAPILFTSKAKNPQAGDYCGIHFWNKNAHSSELTWCTIEHAGSDYGTGSAVFLDDTKITMQNCTVKKSSGYGIRTEYDASFVLFSENSVSECAEYPISVDPFAVSTLEATNSFSGMGIEIRGGNLSTDNYTWQKFDIPYVIFEVWIDNGAELTLTPGSVFKFQANGAIVVSNSDNYGKLVARGTADSPIVFTSAASSPSPGDWSGLIFYEKTMTGSILDYCHVAYAGSNYWHESAVYIEYCDSKVTVQNCNISYSSGCGITIYDATPVLLNNTYQNNGEDLCY